MVGLYFDRWRPLALGIAMVGSSAGALTFPPILFYINAKYSLRGTLVMIGGIAMQCSIFSALLIPITYSHDSPSGTQSKPKMSKTKLYSKQAISLMCNSSFILHFVSVFLFNFGASTVWILIPEYARECTMSKNQGALLVSLISFGSMFGRILMTGITTLFPRLNRVIIYNASCLAIGIPIALYPAGEAFVVFALMSVCFGLMFGCMYCLFPIILADIHGAEMLTSTFSYQLLAVGLGFASGPPVSGLLTKPNADAIVF